MRIERIHYVSVRLTKSDGKLIKRHFPKGKGLRELAAMCGISVAYISKILNGKDRCPTPVLGRIYALTDGHEDLDFLLDVLTKRDLGGRLRPAYESPDN